MAAITWEEAKAHVGELMPARIEQRALEAIPHYIWMEKRHDDNTDMTGIMCKRKPVLMGFCTKCLQWHAPNGVPGWGANDPYIPEDIDEQEFDCQSEWEVWPKNRNKHTGKVMHGDLGHCLNCGAKAQYRYLSKGFKTLYDRILLVEYRKSMTEENALVCVGYDVEVEWKHMDPYDAIYPPMNIQPCEVCVFRYGTSADRFLLRDYWIYSAHPDPVTGQLALEQHWQEWERKNECKSGYIPGAGLWGQTRTRTVLDVYAYRDAIEGTPFGRILQNNDVEGEAAGYYDKITLLARIAKYPCIEYLYKLGHPKLAEYAIDGKKGNLLNLRGKTAKSVMRLTDTQWGEVKGKKITLTPGTLEVLQWSKQEHLRAGMELWAWVGGAVYGMLDSLKQIRKGYPDINMVETIKYLRRRNLHARDYRDYLGQLQTLRMDMKDKSMLYPSNFAEFHARLSDRIQTLVNKDAGKLIKKNLQDLKEYCFSEYGLVLRPMLSAKEVIDEGSALHHCVGDYVKQYASGGIVLCCLRREESMSTPLYTVEFGRDGKLIQCRGAYNRTKEGDKETLKQFWKLFEAMRADYKAQTAKEGRKIKQQSKQKERKTA